MAFQFSTYVPYNHISPASLGVLEIATWPMPQSATSDCLLSLGKYKE